MFGRVNLRLELVSHAHEQFELLSDRIHRMYRSSNRQTFAFLPAAFESLCAAPPCAREFVAQHQAFKLNFGTAMDHDQFIEALVTTRFDHQSSVYDADAVRILGLPVPQDLILARDDERMKNVIQPLPLVFIREDLRSESFPVERSIRVQNFFAK